MGYTFYDMMPQVYAKSGWFDVPRLTNGFMVTNTGDTIVKVNDQVFYPGVPGISLGDSKSFGGNQGEVYAGRLKVSFQTPIGAAPQIEVTYKVYVN